MKALIVPLSIVGMAFEPPTSKGIRLPLLLKPANTIVYLRSNDLTLTGSDYILSQVARMWKEMIGSSDRS